ncbi:hypothetical protein kvi_151 [Escherichia phage kvi]|uniref:Uncharacterized protein n=1 Tax=Escherichia phage kvi TaxID=2696413 RepID=A0A6B9X4M9_9CAUD|nr:hypothetical protein kvi_151 [Escherichia phage kvi]
MANEARRKKSLDTRCKPTMTNEQLQDFLAVALNSSKKSRDYQAVCINKMSEHSTKRGF